jgi:plastocyanin
MSGRSRLFRLCTVGAVWLLAIPVVLTAAAASESRPAGQEVTIQIIGLRMVPEHVEISTGTTVTWVNNEPLDYPAAKGQHQIKADDGSWESTPMAPGTRWSRRFDAPGTFAYRCTQHSGAAGQIVVTGEAIAARPLEVETTITEGNPDDPKSWGFTPVDLVVQTGTTITWRNNGRNMHTVSADDKTFESGELAPGATWSMRFDSPGTFAYHCTPHPWMKASVRVVEPGGEIPPPPAPVAADHSHTAPAAPPAATRQGDEPVRHQVDIIEPDPADPGTWTFNPPALDARVGDTIVWRNTGSMEHTVTADDHSFDSGIVPAGGTWSRTVDAPAYAAYHCTPHPWMKAVLRVAALDGAPPPAPPVTAGRSAASKRPRPAATERVGTGPVRHVVDIIEPDLTNVKGWAFSPSTLDVRVGDTVVFRNAGAMQHTATADAGSFDSGMIDGGATWSKRFDSIGAFAYHCTPHPWMKGVIRVSEADGPVPALPADGGDSGAGFAPGAEGEQAASLPVKTPPAVVGPGADLPVGQPPSGRQTMLIVAVVLAGLVKSIDWCRPTAEERARLRRALTSS